MGAGLMLGLSLLTSATQIYGSVAASRQRRNEGAAQAMGYQYQGQMEAQYQESVARTYRANAKIAERNAQMALQDAMAARLSTLRRVEDVQMMGRLRRGSMTAATAARGVVANTGSPLEALAADAYETGKHAAEEHLTGMTQARDLEIEAINHRFRAAYDKNMAGYSNRQADYARQHGAWAGSQARRSANTAARVGLVQGIIGGATTAIHGFGQYRSLLASTPSASQPMVSQWAPPPYMGGLPFQMPPGE